MPFPVAITGDQLTQLRQPYQRFKQFLAVTPFEIVWQAEVNENLTATVYDEFEWQNEDGAYGGYADVKEGMTVFITSSAGSTATDFAEPVLRGRVRSAPGATTFYINELGVNIDNTMFVTVIYDYDLFERVQKTDVDGVWYKDSTITYAPLPPHVSDGLQSTYIDYSGDATVTIAFAPTISPVADGATVSSVLWDVDDGSITVGTTTTNNITVEFPGAGTNEWRWVRLEFTDSNGESYYFVFQVFTVDITDAANSDVLVMIGGRGATVQSNWIEGFSTAKLANEDVSGILANTRCTLFSVGWYGSTTTPIVTNIMMIGRLRAEITSQNTDLDTARDSTVNFSLEGFGQQLGALPVPPLAIIDTDSPDDFTEVTDPTPRRAVMYILIWHSTFASLCAVQFDSGVDDYIDQKFLMDDTSSMLNMVNQQSKYYQAQMTFASSGEAAVKREANYIATVDRGSIPAIFVALSVDRAQWEITIDPRKRVSMVETGATTYNSTTKTRTPYLGRSPVQGLGAGHEPERLDGILLLADQTESDTQNELQSITGNHLENLNSKPVLRVIWAGAGGYWWITPVQWQVYKFVIAAGENIRGLGIPSTDTWLCTSISHSHDNETGTKTVTAIFEMVSLPGRAGRYAGQIIIDQSTGEAPVYTGSVYPSDPDNPLVNYPDNDPDFLLNGFPTSTGSGPVEDALNEPSALGTQTLNVPMWIGTTVSTANDTVNGETYQITIEGDAVIFDDAWVYKPDFRVDFDGWDIGDHAILLGVKTTGVGFEDTTESSGTSRQRGVRRATKTFTACNITRVDTRFDYKLGNVTNPVDIAFATAGNILPFTSVNFTDPNVDTGNGKINRVEGTWVGETKMSLVIISDSKQSPFEYAGWVIIYRAEIAGTGTPPPEFTDVINPLRGDAFYYGYDTSDGAAIYGGLTGLLLNGAAVSSIPLYSSVHSYTFLVTGDGNPITFKYADADYTNNDRVNLVVTVSGSGMNPEVLP